MASCIHTTCYCLLYMSLCIIACTTYKTCDIELTDKYLTTDTMVNNSL